MMSDLVLFYNLSGIVMCFLAVLMFVIRKQTGEDGSRFNVARYYLAIMILLSGLSMFTAQFDRGLVRNSFEILNPLMLLFFFLITQGFLMSFFVLYASRYASRRTFNRILLPVLVLFAIYTIAYFLVGDEPVYSAKEFFEHLPHEPMLVVRCVILVAMAASILYCIRLCHQAKAEYHNLISGYFSETDFSRSIWLANLLASAEALAGWIFLTYFYTTQVLETVVGILMVALFAFYVKEFYEYRKRYERFRPMLLFAAQGDVVAKIEEEIHAKPKGEADRCAVLLANWQARTDKPFTRRGLTIGDVSKDLGIPGYLISGYVNRNQSNFCSWINDLRIGEASRLLCDEPSLSISDIAERTGFCDLPAFSRAFKKIHHISPREYRNTALYVRDDESCVVK